MSEKKGSMTSGVRFAKSNGRAIGFLLAALIIIASAQPAAQRAERGPAGTARPRSQKKERHPKAPPAKKPAPAKPKVSQTPNVIPPASSPTKEYIYAGGKLIATEEPANNPAPTISSLSPASGAITAGTLPSLNWSATIKSISAHTASIGW